MTKIALVAMLLAAAGHASASGRSSGPICASHDRAVASSSRPGAKSELVPPGPRSVLLCRYSGLGQHPRSATAFGLIEDLLVTKRATVTSIASRLNRLRSSPGAFACPADFGDAIVAVFSYGSGRVDTVKVGLSGCTLVSNGQVVRTAAFAPGPALIRQLMAMTSR